MIVESPIREPEEITRLRAKLTQYSKTRLAWLEAYGPIQKVRDLTAEIETTQRRLSELERAWNRRFVRRGLEGFLPWKGLTERRG